METKQSFEDYLTLAITQWIVNHKQLKEVVTEPLRLIRLTSKQSIDVSLQFFAPEYYSKHIGKDREKYCMKLLKSLEKPMFKALSAFKPQDFQFTYTFHYYGHFISKTVTYYMHTRVQ